MKKILYFLSFVFVALFTACSEGDDFDIDYTPIAPIGGQYRINVEKVMMLLRPMQSIGLLTRQMLNSSLRLMVQEPLRVFSMPISAILPIMIRIRLGFV